MQKIVLFFLALSVSSLYSMEELTDAQRAAIMNLNIIKKQLAVGKAEGLIPDAFFRNCEAKKQQFPDDVRMQQEINQLIKEAKEINAPLVEKN